MQMTDTEGALFDAHFAFSNTSDVQNITNLGFPLMVGYEWAGGVYLAIGGKVAFNISGSSKTTTYVSTTSYYGNLIGDNNDGILSDIPNHGMLNEFRVVRQSLSLNPIITGSAEIGYTFSNNLGDFVAKRRPKFRLSLFVDYGISSVKGKEKTDALFVNTSKTGQFIPAIQGYLLNGANLNKLNVFFTGMKLSILLGTKKYKCNCK